MTRNQKTTVLASQLAAIARSHRKDVAGLCQRLVQVPSISGDEGAIARLVADEMRRLEYDDVWTDHAGNVIGVMRGNGGPSLLLNGHLDHVGVGDEAAWPIAPYLGVERDGFIWGRGAADMKGSVAAQILAIALLRKSGFRLPGDVWVACVVMEEVGGLGTRELITQIKPDYAIVGEATNNNIACGHRGRIELVAEFEGRSSHAGMPELGANPYYPLAKFLLGLRSLSMSKHANLGKATVAPTVMFADQSMTNVIPRRAGIYLDWRTVPGETTEDIIDSLRKIADLTLEPGVSGQIRITEKILKSYTGYTGKYLSVYPGFAIAPDAPAVLHARGILQDVLQSANLVYWSFASDAAHLANAGAVTIGFGPGDESIYHTLDERISINQLSEAVAGNMALALQWTQSA